MRSLEGRGCTVLTLLQESRAEAEQQKSNWLLAIFSGCVPAAGLDTSKEGSVRLVFVSFATASVRNCDLELLDLWETLTS